MLCNDMCKSGIVKLGGKKGQNLTLTLMQAPSWI